MVELVMVMVLIGILGAVAGNRFFGSQVFEARAYADQSKALIRYAQKLAIAQNRNVYVRSTPDGFAVCLDAGAACATPGDRVQAPGGGNNGSAATRSFCVSGAYVANWACIGRPAAVAVAVNGSGQRAEMAAGGFFFFDAAGRPFNRADPASGGSSTFARLTLNVRSGNQTSTLNVEAETGYVF